MPYPMEAIDAQSLYNALVALDVPIDSHESDLYVLRTPETHALVEQYDDKCNVTMFRHAIDNTTWYDIPFAFMPFWDSRARKEG